MPTRKSGARPLLSKANLGRGVVGADLLLELLRNLLGRGARGLGHRKDGSGSEEGSIASEFSAALL